MNCLYCNKEFKSKRATAKYCSPNCRKLAFLSVPEVSVPTLSVPEKEAVSVPNERVSVPKPLSVPTAEDLYDAISSYPEDTWKDSPEYEELMKRLRSTPIKVLEERGYYIPSWKYSEENKKYTTS
jgi:hypothetical protein